VAAGWSWVDDAGNFDIRAPKLFLHHRGAATRERAAPLRLLHAAAAVAAVRWLVMTGEGQKFSATELAQAVGVTQPRASQLLKVFTAEGLTLRVALSQWSANRAQCLDAFLEHYRGPGGTLRYFYSLDEPLDVALQIARTMPVGAYALSADVGPDLLAPVRRPSHLVVYLRMAEQVERMRWTTAKGAHDANIVVRIPTDQSVFWKGSAVSVRSQSLVLAHPTQMLWDLEQLGEGDRTAAVEAMKAWIRNNRETSSASKRARSPKT
jgi:DNA-binding transcriptional ArsR family regulator